MALAASMMASPPRVGDLAISVDRAASLATAHIDLHPAQIAFRNSPALYRAFVGGRGAGKSWVGAYDMLRRARPERLYAVYAPTYPMLRDATLRSLRDMASTLRLERAWGASDHRLTLHNGAEIICRSLDDPERARGPNLSGAWIDEASLVPQAAFDIVIACLREGGERGWLSATFTPKGKTHWTFAMFGGDRADTATFRAATGENPFAPIGFADGIRSQYTHTYALQEVDGAFVDLEGAVAKREWFRIVEAVPSGGQRVRYWDAAATEKKAISDDPDYTVGARVITSEGKYYVDDIIRGQYGPGNVEQVISQTAALDGPGVSIVIEQEPGSSGKLWAASLIRILAGYDIRAQPSTGDKLTRAMPFLAQAQAGNVSFLRAPWTADAIEELCAFPVGSHDDQVDAMAGAFAALAKGARLQTIDRRILGF